MPSNSLTHRRTVVRRPIVCKKGPPPIDAPPWPPDPFLITVVADYSSPYGSRHVEYSHQVPRQPLPQWNWIYDDRPGPETYLTEWLKNAGQDFYLRIMGTDSLNMPFWFVQLSVPTVWEKYTNQNIYTWSSVRTPGDTALATFAF